MSASTKTFVNNNLPQCEDVDLNGFTLENNNLIEGAGFTLDTGDRQQTHKSVAQYSMDGDFFTDSGVADAYVLSALGSKQGPRAYTDGLRVRFSTANANTGAATVNVDSLGVKNIKLADGSDPSAGDIDGYTECRFDLANDRFELLASKASTGSSYDVNQVAHGFAVGDVLRLSGATYVKAQADSVANAEVVGVVSATSGSDDFTIQVGGRLEGLSTLTAGEDYYLDPATAGAVTTTKPTAIGDIIKPIYIADTTTSAVLTPYVGVEITADSTIAAASQADQEAGTSTTVYTNPGVQQYHPSAAKAWVVFDGTTGSILDSYNVTSVTRNSTGDYTINFTVNFSSANYVTLGTAQKNATNDSLFVAVKRTVAPTSSAVTIITIDDGALILDAQKAFVAFFGDQ
jgi:hypothetical protein